MSSTSGGASGLAGLDRKQMEQERLARQAARKRGVDASDAVAETKRIKLSSPNKPLVSAEVVVLDEDGSIADRSVKQASQEGIQRKAEVKQGVSATPLRKPASPNSSLSVEPASSTETRTLPAASHSLEYPNGTLKKTWAFGYPRNNDIKFEEVIQKNTLTTAIISSWQWEFDWLMTKVVPGKTKFVFVIEAKTEQDVSDLARSSLTVALDV